MVTNEPKIQHLVSSYDLQHKHQHTTLKKEKKNVSRKVRRRLQNMLNFLAKRIKKAKEKHKEQIAKRNRLSSLRASTSKSE